MTASLPPSLLALFAPRPPIPYLPPIDKPKLPPLQGVAQFVHALSEPQLPPDPTSIDPQLLKAQKREEKFKKHAEELAKKIAECMLFRLTDWLLFWSLLSVCVIGCYIIELFFFLTDCRPSDLACNALMPAGDPDSYENATRDPYRTLFVGRLVFQSAFINPCMSLSPSQSYDTTESKLRREFEQFGPVKKVAIFWKEPVAVPRDLIVTRSSLSTIRKDALVDMRL
jgi:U1 small nuclear ribonucleoprotein